MVGADDFFTSYTHRNILGIAGACIGFGLELSKLQNDQTSNQQSDNVMFHQQQNNESIHFLYQQLIQQNESINTLYQKLSQQNEQLNSSTQLLLSVLEGPVGNFPFHPAVSCAALPPSSPSGYYWVRASNGSAVSVYCNMTLSCGGLTGGWIRVAELDMTNSSHQCPSGLGLHTDSDKRVCEKIDTKYGCTTLNHFDANYQYSNICGRIIGYQIGTSDAFYSTRNNINSVYVDGVSLTRTRGNLRHHIWTFASGASHGASGPPSCPCNGSDATPPPAFVGEDYFCDTGNPGPYTPHLLFDDDPLWDGAGCRAGNTCCSFNNPPWFYKQLPQPTTDDIEMRVCTSGGDENIGIEIVEIFIQ